MKPAFTLFSVAPLIYFYVTEQKVAKEMHQERKKLTRNKKGNGVSSPLFL